VPAPGGSGAARAGALRWLRDGDLSVPSAALTDVAWFLMQHRLGRVHGAPGGYDLDVMLYPNTNCPALDVAEHATHLGHKTPFNTNLLPHRAVVTTHRAQSEESVAAEAEAAPAGAPAENASIFFACSSDATCYPPFAPNTGCTGDAQQTAAHFHFYYVDNDPAMLAAVLKFVASLESSIGVSHMVSPDNFGHEQPHNKTTWLEGPGGGGPLPAPANTTGPGGSFVYPAFALYGPGRLNWGG
jgi:hypothetical protein